MSAINLYVAVDWQGDREIERARGEGGQLQREARGAEGEREKEDAGDAKTEKEKERKRSEGGRKKGRQEGNVKEGENTQATDTPFLLIEIQFEREASPAIPRESNYPGIIGKRTIPTRARFVYTTHSTASFAHRARSNDERVRDRDISRVIKKNCSFFKLFCF